MNLTELLKFLPLIIGAFLAYHLIFRQKLPAENLGAILTYFLGTLIVFIAISWLITTFLADWATDLLEAGTTSTEWQQFMDASENVVENAFSANPQPAAQPTVVQVVPLIITATPGPGGVVSPDQPAVIIGPTEHLVKTGDTLYGIAQQYGTTVNAIMAVNGLTNYIIQPGQVLKIPAATK